MPKKDASDDALRCSFCNKSQREVKKLIAGPTVFICDECVDICLDIGLRIRMRTGFNFVLIILAEEALAPPLSFDNATGNREQKREKGLFIT